MENVSLSCEQNPLALIKGSPIPITQHSELLSAAYTLTIQLFLSCCFFVFFLRLAHPQHSSLLYDSEVLGRVTVHLYHLPIKQDSPCRPRVFVAQCQALCLF